MTRAWLETDDLRVAVAPAYGARVVSLFDKRNRREWMTQGAASPNTAEDAVYGGAEAVGWDECFPTVGAWAAGRTAWKRPLRDHGDLWGRPWTVTTSGPTSLATSYNGVEFSFVRELSVDGPRLSARYAVTNLLSEPLPYLWALHSLFAVEPGDRVELGGVDTVHASFMARNGQMLGSGPVAWSGGNAFVPFPLDEVQPRTSLFAGKFLVGDVPGGRARLGRPGQWLDIAWDERIDSLGIWVTYGAWPSPGGHQEVAIEPTSAAANDLGEAIGAGARALAPGERREWQVTLTVSGRATTRDR